MIQNKAKGQLYLTSSKNDSITIDHEVTLNEVECVFYLTNGINLPTSK